MLGTRLGKFAAALQCPAAVLLLGGWGLAAEPDVIDPVGTVHLGDTSCPPGNDPAANAYCPPGSPYMMSPAAPAYPPGMPIPYAPSMQFPGQAPRSTTPSTPSAQQPSTSQQRQNAPPAQAPPTFTPSASTTAATAPQSTAPNMVGDFFGGVATEPIILPGAVVDQAILRQPGVGLLDYYRVVTPTGVGMFQTATEVLLGTDLSGLPASVTPTAMPPQLLTEFDGGQFVGDPAAVLDVTAAGPFLTTMDTVAADGTFLSDTPTVGDVVLLAPEPTGTLIGETIYNVRDAVLVFVPTPGSGGTVGRQKIVENNSVFPRNRVFLNYSAFSNVPLTGTGQNVHRFVPGFEMAFFEERMSVEVRLPFAATLDTDIRAGGLIAGNVTEFGNIVGTLKGMIYNHQGSVVTVGMSTTLPTASDITVTGLDGQQVLSLENTSVHVLPFIGAAHSEGRWFSQGFIQGDIDTSGNRVEAFDSEIGRLREVGELNDAAFLYVGGSVGYWVYQNGTAQTTFSRQGRRMVKRTVHAHDHWITGFAPLVEVQFNRSLEKSETIEAGNIRIRTFDQFSLTNLVLGGLMTFGNGGSLTVAWVKPIIGRDDQQFDDEIRVAVDWSL